MSTGLYGQMRMLEGNLGAKAKDVSSCSQSKEHFHIQYNQAKQVLQIACGLKTNEQHPPEFVSLSDTLAAKQAVGIMLSLLMNDVPSGVVNCGAIPP